ncbi:hypothetical protein BX666DRAFT_2026039 [Dichotomocladium elegans]|nr:hypothetical protein BX666DRAFT_2026039 [Dichotomocladium elegans]
MEGVDTELKDLNICDQLRANSSFMKIMATLFHYGNQSMNAAQLVIAVRALNLLPLRGETPKSTIQGIISTSRKAARDLRQPDPFHIDKDNSGRQAKYSIAETVLNGAAVPAVVEIPDEPIILKPVEHSSAYASAYAGHLGKRQRKMPKFYTPEAMRKAKNRRARANRLRRKKEGFEGAESDTNTDVDVDMDDDFEYVKNGTFAIGDFMSMDSSEEDDSQTNALAEEDTISGYSLVYAPPPSIEAEYIDPINFEEYPVASYFAIAQQKGYSYPRFRSHEKVKIPKVNCEDKFRVADIVSESSKQVVGRMFILADGHGGRGCSEFFVRKTPAAVQKLCSSYDPEKFDSKQIQKSFEKDIKRMVEALDTEYLTLKRIQLGRFNQQQQQQQQQQQHNTQESAGGSTPSASEEGDNDGCTLIINIFFGNWMINVNVGDSRSVLISAPDPASSPPKSAEELSKQQPYVFGFDNDYKMDVVFASQDHKPYLEHLAREILENGGEFIDSVQDRVIRVDLDKLREDGNRQTKRVALKNARIRPKGYHSNNHNSNNDQLNEDINQGGFAAQSAVRTTANQFIGKIRSRDERVPSLNVARSCGDLDFKMDPDRKIISCEPDVSFFRIADEYKHPLSENTILSSSLHKEKRRHFLFMSTDGMFDYMYEETAERQNRAVAKVLGPMIEEGEKIGQMTLEEEQRGGETIEHNPSPKPEEGTDPIAVESNDKNESSSNSGDTNSNSKVKENSESPASGKKEEGEQMVVESSAPAAVEQEQPQEPEQTPPPVPRLFREISEEDMKTRETRERTLVHAARFFANREGVHGFFSSTLQDYDDCTIVLIEI